MRFPGSAAPFTARWPLFGLDVPSRLLAVQSLVGTVVFPVIAQDGSETRAWHQPPGLDISTEQEMPRWDDLDGANGYLVGRREASPDKLLNEQVRVQESGAVFTVADYGKWVARLEACLATDCGKDLAQRFNLEAAPEPTPATTQELTPTTTQTQTPEPNHVPAVGENADQSDAFTGWNNASRATPIRNTFDGIFGEPDGEAVACTAPAAVAPSAQVEAVGARLTGHIPLFQFNGDDDRRTVSRAPPESRNSHMKENVHPTRRRRTRQERTSTKAGHCPSASGHFDGSSREGGDAETRGVRATGLVRTSNRFSWRN